MELNDWVGKSLNQMANGHQQFLDDDVAYLLRDWRDEKTPHMKTRKRNAAIKFMEKNEVPYWKEIAKHMMA